jgi:tRNA (adenine37-N6)-methyltransferase
MEIILSIQSSLVGLTLRRKQETLCCWQASLTSITLACSCSALAFVGFRRYHKRISARIYSQDETAGNLQKGLLLKQAKAKPEVSVRSHLLDTASKKALARLTLSDQLEESNGALLVNTIGHVRSVYRLCVGTPRQGLLAPQARGRIELDSNIDFDAVQELEKFSHIWVIFIFHLNTVGQRRRPSKIAPPTLGGSKIGVLASRSPHRFNPLGISLVKLDRVERATINRNGKKPSTSVHLHVSGLDLVDETPIVDIKPYVSIYDAPISGSYHAPSWVTEGLNTFRQVEITEQAQTDLHDIIAHDPHALEFYSGLTAERDVLDCIKQVLAMDVRSAFQTSKAREGKFQAERASRLGQVSTHGLQDLTSLPFVTITQQIDRLLVYYYIEQREVPQRVASVHSGAEDYVVVTSITLL